MAAVAAEANLLGTSDAVSAAQVLVQLASSVAGSSDSAGAIGGTFTFFSDMAAQATLAATGGVSTFASVDLAGQGTVAAAAQFLFYSDVAGEAALTAVGNVAVNAVGALQGQATTTQEPLLTLAGAAAASGDAQVGADADVALDAVAAVSGDATVGAFALLDDEIASDVYAEATTAAAPTMVYAATAGIVAGSSVTPVAIVRPAFLRQALPLAQVGGEERLLGYQPGREAHRTSAERFTISTVTRTRVDVSEVESSVDRTRVQDAPQDQASKDARERVTERERVDG